MPRRSLYGHSHDFIYTYNALWWRKINRGAHLYDKLQRASDRRSDRPGPAVHLIGENWEGSRFWEKERLMTAHAANTWEQLLDGKCAQVAFSQRPLVWYVFHSTSAGSQNAQSKLTERNLSIKTWYACRLREIFCHWSFPYFKLISKVTYTMKAITFLIYFSGAIYWVKIVTRSP